MNLNHALLVAATIFSGTTFAGIHNYRIEQVSPTYEGCRAAENAVVVNFTQVTSASVLSHGCEQNPGRTFDLDIEYSHPSGLNLVTTYNEFGVVHGLYNSEQDCASQRNAKIAEFRSFTGLDPVVAYCYFDYHQEDSDSSWTLRIESFGNAKLIPHNFGRYLYDGGDLATQSISANIIQVLNRHGAVGASAKVSAYKNTTTLMISYYAPKELSLVEYYQGYFENPESCESYRGDVNQIFTRAGGNTATFFCVSNQYSFRTRIYTLGIVTQPLANELSSVKYPSYQACEAKRGEVEAAWRSGLGRDIIGSICAIDEIIGPLNIRMRLFWTE